MLVNASTVQEMHTTCFPKALAVTTKMGWTYVIGPEANETNEWRRSADALSLYVYRASYRNIGIKNLGKVMGHPDCITSMGVHTLYLKKYSKKCKLHSSVECFQRAHLDNMFSSRLHFSKAGLVYVGAVFTK